MSNYKLPLGFKISGISSGIKKSAKKDLGLIYSESPCIGVGAFTKNKVQAAPVTICKENLANKISALIANSGNANCFTGKKGLEGAHSVLKALAAQLQVKASQLLIASTGIIGVDYPVSKVIHGIPSLIESLSKEGIAAFAESILTTDTFPKIKSLELKLGKAKVSICGFAKGAGMIAPDLEMCLKVPLHATMFCFILTDAFIKRDLLNKALKEVIEESFNAINIDGCMSTNDTVLVLSNGLAGNKVISNEGSDYKKFKEALKEVACSLAKMIVKDGEGATKFIKVEVQKASSFIEAKKAAQAVANSLLFKCALYGEDPNWGRIVAAIGASGVSLKEGKTDIFFNDVAFVLNSKIQEVKNKYEVLKNKEINIRIVLNKGKFKASVWTCDVSVEYVKINADYS